MEDTSERETDYFFNAHGQSVAQYQLESNPWVWVYEFMRVERQAKETIDERRN